MARFPHTIVLFSKEGYLLMISEEVSEIDCDDGRTGKLTKIIRMYDTLL